MLFWYLKMDLPYSFFFRRLIKSQSLRSFFNECLDWVWFGIAVFTVRKRHADALKLVRKKSQLRVAFFVLEEAIWKCDEVFKEMLLSKEFSPFIFVCPNTSCEPENIFHEMKKTAAFFCAKKFETYTAYDFDSNSWVNVLDQLKPDIIFFSTPHHNTRLEYRIHSFPRTLTCYVPYGVMAANLQKTQYNKVFHNLLWKHFLETSVHKEMAIKYSRNKGSNAVVTGYPFLDDFFSSKKRECEKWKIKNSKIKKIIWAPHHSIEDDSAILGYSTFLKYHETMLEIAIKYQNQIQLAFKPHPYLKSKLFRVSSWGTKKTNDYFSAWDNLSNGIVSEGSYFDLFLTSDAMIFDSISFVTEYMCTGKSSLFLVKDSGVKDKFNEFGQRAFGLLYLGYDSNSIESFIQNVVIEGRDNMKSTRDSFVRDVLCPPNSYLASENIIKNLKESIWN